MIRLFTNTSLRILVQRMKSLRVHLGGNFDNDGTERVEKQVCGLIIEPTLKQRSIQMDVLQRQIRIASDSVNLSVSRSRKTTAIATDLTHKIPTYRIYIYIYALGS